METVQTWSNNLIIPTTTLGKRKRVSRTKQLPDQKKPKLEAVVCNSPYSHILELQTIIQHWGEEAESERDAMEVKLAQAFAAKKSCRARAAKIVNRQFTQIDQWRAALQPLYMRFKIMQKSPVFDGPMHLELEVNRRFCMSL